MRYTLVMSRWASARRMAGHSKECRINGLVGRGLRVAVPYAVVVGRFNDSDVGKHPDSK